MPNQFDTTPVNVLQALMLGQQSFDKARGYAKEREMMAGRRAAADALASGGDTRGALARLMAAGDVQGAQALAQFGNQAFDQNYKTQMLDIYRRNADKKDIPTGFQPAPSGGLAPIPGGPADPNYKRQVGDRQNAPPGYLWNDPQNPEAGLRPIPGGPGEKVDAEVAARLGLGRSFLGQLPDTKNEKGETVPGIMSGVKAGEATGPIDFLAGKAGWGAAGKLHRRIASGAEALLRNLTGAGMNKDEAAEYVDRYRPSIKDTAETLADKLTQLERELNSVMETVGRGRGGMPPLGQPGARSSGPITKQQYDQLPSGTPYTAPDGSQRIKP